MAQQALCITVLHNVYRTPVLVATSAIHLPGVAQSSLSEARPGHDMIHASCLLDTWKTDNCKGKINAPGDLALEFSILSMYFIIT